MNKRLSARIALALCFALLLQLLAGPIGSLIPVAFAAEEIDQVLYEEDFSDYETTSVALGTEAVAGWTKTEGNDKVNFTLSDGRLNISTSNVSGAPSYGFAQLDVEGSDEWSNYVVEFDMAYTVANTGWFGLAYNTTSYELHQKVGLYGTNSYFLNARIGGSNFAHDTPPNQTSTSLFSSWGTDTWRIKLVTSNMDTDTTTTGSATLYIAPVTDGVAGTFQKVVTVDNLYAQHYQGTLGVQSCAYTVDGWIDNIKVYTLVDSGSTDETIPEETIPDETTPAPAPDLDPAKNYEILYTQDFNSYIDDNEVALVQGSTVEDWYWELGSGTFTLKDGALRIDNGHDNAHLEVDIPGSEYWSNYTVEVDVAYDSGSSWMGIAYNSTGFANGHQKAGTYNGTRYFMNGNWGSWVNNEIDAGAYNQGNLPSGVNGWNPHRLKIVTTGNDGINKATTSMYIKEYTNGVLAEEWTHIYTITNVDERTYRGTVGIACATATQMVNATIDNLVVYREVEVLYEDTFDTDATLPSGTTTGNWELNGNAQAEIKDGAMYVNGVNGMYGLAMLRVEGSEDWQNYTVECDMTYNGSLNWAGLAYNVTDDANYQKVGLFGTTNYYVNGRAGYTSGGSVNWVNDGGLNNTSHPQLNTVDGGEFRLKVQTWNQTGWAEGSTWLQVAYYNQDGTLGEWIDVRYAENIYPATYKGTVGFAMGSALPCSIIVDNLIVYAGDNALPQPPEPPNVADIYVPRTNITNPPVVAQVITDALPATEGERAALAIVKVDVVDDVLSIVGEDGVLAAAADFVDSHRDYVIPAFVVDSEEEVDALIAIIQDKDLIDAYMVVNENDLDLPAYARGTYAEPRWEDLRYAVLVTDVGSTEADWTELCATLANDTHITNVFALNAMSMEAMTYFNNHALAVWGVAEDKTDVYTAVANGYHGVLTVDPGMIFDTYDEFTTRTISGRPITISHRGAHLSYGAQSDAKGENTVDSFLYAINTYGCIGVETDLRLTMACDPSTCEHDCADHSTCELCQPTIVLQHDTSGPTASYGLMRTTNVADIYPDRAHLSTKSFTMYELKQLTVDYYKDLGENWTGKMATFEEALAATEELGLVYYCHINDKPTEALFNELLAEHPEYVDNCVIFMDTDGINSYYNWNSLTVPVPLTFADNNTLTEICSRTDPLDSIEGLIELMNRHDGHFLGYNYRTHSDGDDSFYYQIAARGVISYHSVTNGQAALNSYMLTGMGPVGALTDDIYLTEDWHYYVDAADAALEVGESIDLTHNVLTMVPGSYLEQQTCGFVILEGDAVDAQGNAVKAGESTIAYYYDRTADGGASYRVYSEAVTVTVTDPAAEESAKKVAAVEKAISDIGTVTLESKEAIEAAREAYDALTEAEKDQVENYDVLTEAEAAYEQAVKDAADAEALAQAKSDAKAEIAALYETLKEDLSQEQKALLDEAKAKTEAAIDSAASIEEVSAATSQGADAMREAVKEEDPELLPVPDYTDVDRKAWYYSSLEYMVQRGHMSGVSATEFAPNKNLTRAQLVSILYRIAGEPSVEGLNNPFTDVPAGKWYTDAIIWASSEGIVSGVSKTLYAPDRALTREQFAAMLYRWAKAEPVEEDALAAFPDGGSVSNYAVDAMNWAVSNGLISGIARDGKAYLTPQGTTTRAQAASVLARYLQKQ